MERGRLLVLLTFWFLGSICVGGDTHTALAMRRFAWEDLNTSSVQSLMQRQVPFVVSSTAPTTIRERWSPSWIVSQLTQDMMTATYTIDGQAGPFLPA